MSELLRDDVPCTDPDCGTVLAGPTDPSLCEDCREQFEQAGIPTRDEQLELVPDEEQAT